MTKKKENYRILGLHAENIKKLKVVDITVDPAQPTVVIKGKNGNGKTSILDAIFWACAGEKHIQEMPIRRGADKGVVELDLGTLKIRRTFTEKGSYLFVEAADGARYPSPQKMLDDMLGAIAFDPLAFTRMEIKKQYETLREIAPVAVDIDALDKKTTADREERRIVNRQVAELEAQIAGITFPEDTPEEMIDVVEKTEQLTQGRDNRNVAENEYLRLKNVREQLQRDEESIKTRREQYEIDTAALEEAIKDLPTKEVLALIEQEVRDAAAINLAVAQRNKKVEKNQELEAKRIKAENLDAAIAGRDKEKADAIAAAKMPVDGLSLENGQVFYGGVPFSQASNADQIRISTAIAMAGNPALRVIRIKDGGLLDDDSMAEIKRMAKANDFQIWIERINDDDPLGILIEDGAVAGVEEAA